MTNRSLEGENNERKFTLEAVVKQMKTVKDNSGNRLFTCAHEEFMPAAQIQGIWTRLASRTKKVARNVDLIEIHIVQLATASSGTASQVYKVTDTTKRGP